jgi:hypothetical protein
VARVTFAGDLPPAVAISATAQPSANAAVSFAAARRGA